jgi:hypothetical protein
MTTITLSRPVAHGPLVVSGLHFRKPGFGDLELVRRATTSDDIDALCALVARLADIPLAASAAIDLADVAAVTAALVAHLEAHVGGANGGPAVKPSPLLN